MQLLRASRVCAIVFGCFCTGAFAQRPMTIDDIAKLATIDDPQLSPDGEWVAYTVSTVDRARDRRLSTIWMASWEGSKQIQLTHGPESASSPRWSPDGRYLSFMRPGAGKDEGEQLWLMDRAGGEARQLTRIRGELSEYSWSPDSKRLALVLREEEPQVPDTNEDAAEHEEDDKRPRPLVIDRYQFKSDELGYHSTSQRPRIFLYDIASGALTTFTGTGTFAESSPTWSPDGKRIAFVSNRDEDWDRTENYDVWVSESRAGAQPRRLTSFVGADEAPLSWSPDGRHIAYLQGSEPKYWLYNYYQLAIVPADGGPVRLPTTQLDRDIVSPRFSSDGRWIDFLVTDDRRQYLARMPASGGEVRRITNGDRVITALAGSSRRPQRIALLSSSRTTPSEIYALEAGKLRQLTHHNAAWARELSFGITEEIAFRASDGVEVHGLITRPGAWNKAQRYPTILWIHGGPYGQDAYDFDIEPQLFAAHGYLTVQVNYRGSSGRGVAFGRGIFADWGNADLSDLLAGVDHVIAKGIADPEKLGVGGWSQGSILTNFVIARDQRFKAAVSGAGVANQLGIYGHDQYVYMYDLEFGPPWTNPELWIRLSYPFFNADKIRTPTLFLGGDRDFNVPLLGSEQMYQALKTLKVPTQLIIYPGEKHEISRPSFVRDRYERYLGWFGKHL